MNDIFLINISDTTYFDLLSTVVLFAYVSFIVLIGFNYKFYTNNDLYELLQKINEKL